jgi:hypothetical protein
VNPDHLEPVTHVINMARKIASTKSHCKNGHALTPDNLYRYALKKGERHCIKCNRMHNAKYRAKVKFWEDF